jgi:hypothetical protein
LSETTSGVSSVLGATSPAFSISSHLASSPFSIISSFFSSSSQCFSSSFFYSASITYSSFLFLTSSILFFKSAASKSAFSHSVNSVDGASAPESWAISFFSASF